jgi:hypothetical protein
MPLCGQMLPASIVFIPLTCLAERPKIPRLASPGSAASVAIPAAGGNVEDWQYAQSDGSEELAQVHHFTMKKVEPAGATDFHITVREYAAPPAGHHHRFYAEADKHVNQKTASFLPSGWGESVLKALADCMRLIREFPYQG